MSYHFLSLTGIAGINGKWMGLTSLASLYSWEHSNTSLRLLRLSLAFLYFTFLPTFLFSASNHFLTNRRTVTN